MKNKIKIFVSILILFLAVNFSFAQKRLKNSGKIVYKVDTVFIRDTLIKYIEKKPKPLKSTPKHLTKELSLPMLDSLVSDLFTEKAYNNHDVIMGNFILADTVTHYGKLKSVPDSVLRERFDMMYSEIKLPYHPLMRDFISRYIDNPKQMQIFMQRAIYYFPIFEQELIKNNMPLELKYLPIVESSLLSTAISRGSAGGLWQFMPATAKSYGLNISTYVDQRFDPYKSTEAACRYLRDLYQIYNNWTLVIAAYNCGPGNVNKALAKVKNAESYWDIYNYLPADTRAYVPWFIAVNYAFNFHKNHGFDMDYPQLLISTDTIKISDMILDLRQISSTIDISHESLKFLNPQFHKDIVPAKGMDFDIVLPTSVISEFVEKKDEIFGKQSLYLPKSLANSKVNILDNAIVIHTVRSGDIIGLISRKYGVSVKKIVKDNALSSADKLKIGQKLKIIKT